ncbi:hypothetical protein L915_15746 [Phytophthora nicotianae]|uniref:Uncharacterized protein n=1 Tax=Phytophthora nicotianae TaxID=4792 RepID=W2G7C1_PHYNI|nr:hypothetical protein L915_15746 [Phytophthora nicotianae]ETL31610.1 hypothetical protein L916_15636 [Phytophthora nicotianae]
MNQSLKLKALSRRQSWISFETSWPRSSSLTRRVSR